jgi:peptidoglycan/LPS O-acetylase OafA/YrhL
MRRIQELDGLRAFAVLAVIADHYAPFRTIGNGAMATLGTFGVDLFFVLSGYLITTILLGLRDVERPYRVFYARRSLRILPPFGLLLLLVYGGSVLLHEPISKSKLIGQVLFLRSFHDTGALLSRLIDVVAGHSLVPGLFARIASSPISRDYPYLPLTGSLGPTWSLSVEEWFYFLWAPVVLLCRRRLIVVIGVAFCTMGFLLRWLTGGGANFFTTVDVLISGALLALWLERRSTVPSIQRFLSDRVIGATALCSALLFVLLSVLHRDRIVCSLIEVAVAGGLSWIIINSGSPHPIMAMMRCKPLVYLGTISYMAYLIHLPMYFIVRSAFYLTTMGMPDTEASWIVAVSSILATILFASFSWKYFESPLLGLKDRLTDRVTNERARAHPAFTHEVATGSQI